MSNREKLKSSNNFDSRTDFSKRQKNRAIVFAIFAAVIIVFGVMKIIDQIRSPFIFSTESSQQAAEELNQSLLDSDGDGISDYDELYIYQTSPYLEDSDSDGLSDFEEISQGSDPNCPLGENCLTSKTTISEENTSANLNYLEEMSNEENNLEEGGEIDLNDMTPGLLREILIGSGYDAPTLEQISDEDLMVSYFSALESKDSESSPSGYETQADNLTE